MLSLREEKQMQCNDTASGITGFTVWFTGLPCSGKSTIADALANKLRQVSDKVERLDGDTTRGTFWPELDFSAEDRDKNISRVIALAELLQRNGVVVVASFISPSAELRVAAREKLKDFVLVFTECPLEVCGSRDTRGMYAKAVKGEIKDFTGVSAPYEEPEDADVIVDTAAESVNVSVEKVMDKLEELGYV